MITAGPGPEQHLFAPVNTGARAFLGALKDRGYEIMIFSARSPVELVKKFFKEQDLFRYVDGFTRTKLPARLIVDDRAVVFRGNFDQALREIDEFKPHWAETAVPEPAPPPPGSSDKPAS